MPREDQNLITTFDRIAYSILDSTFGEFSLYTQNIDRHHHENVFRQWQQKYAMHLRQKLGQAAASFVSENQSMLTVDWLQKKIGILIQHYLQVFVQRTQLL